MDGGAAIWVVSLILVLTLYLLITEKLRVDLTALGIMVVLMVSGLLSAKEAVAGLANPAVVTVGAMFLISRAMMRTGAVGFISNQVLFLSRDHQSRAFLVILLLVAVASAFINNTPVVVLFIPVVMSVCCRFETSPSKFLIPVSYASILAGTCTLIGTSTNIIVSDLSQAHGYGQLGMFELSPVGIPIAILGIAFLFFFAPRLMPALSNPICEIRGSERRRYLAELIIPADSRLIGEEPQAHFEKHFPELQVLELIRGVRIYRPGRDRVRMVAGDLLLVKGSASGLVGILGSQLAELPASEAGLHFGRRDMEASVVELIIVPQSALVGSRLAGTGLSRDPDLHLIAIKRSGLHYAEAKLRDIRLRVGDILLVWCPLSRLEELRRSTDFMLVEDVHHEIVHKRKAPVAALIFGGFVTAATLGLADIMVCALTGAFLMILAGCIQLRDAYRALQGEVLLLLAGTIALGTAMDRSGASQLYAHAFIGLFAGFPPVVTLAGLMLLTSISTQVLSNNATAVLLLPIAISAALGLGVDPKPFIVAVCLGASACFATPIGYQTNLLVYTPGGYRFSDYLKLGLPLNLLVLIAGSLIIPHYWPF